MDASFLSNLSLLPRILLRETGCTQAENRRRSIHTPAATPAFHPSRPVESDSRRLWIGLAVSAVGTWMQIVALSLLVLDLTQGSAVALGTVSLAPALYFLLFATESQEPSAALQIFKAAPAGLAACGVGHLAVRP